MTTKKRIKMTKVPFNHKWPGGKITVIREIGPKMVDTALANAAISAGYAVPFNPKPAQKSPNSRSASKKAPSRTVTASLPQSPLSGDK